MSFAQITIVGRLGKDAEVRVTPKGQQITSASVAITNRDKSTTWYNIAAWDAMGKWLAGAQKGEMCFVQGDLEARTYQNKMNETKIEMTVHARSIRVMKQQKEEVPQQAHRISTDDIDFEVPF